MRSNDHIKLYLAFRNHPLYPTNDREFTQFEAWMDILAEAYPEGKVIMKVNPIADRWGWMPSEVFRFFQRLEDLKLVTKIKDTEDYQIIKHDKWYDTGPEDTIPYSEVAEQVIIAFNEIFGRKISLSPNRKEMIIARMRDGKRMKPQVGLDQFVAVFKCMKKAWSNDEKMRTYLEVETLCAKSNFFKYLDRAREEHKNGSVQGKAFTT